MKQCQFCETIPRKRGQIVVFENTVIDPPIHVEVCLSCKAWLTSKFKNYKNESTFVDQVLKKKKQIKKKLGNKKKRKLYKR